RLWLSGNPNATSLLDQLESLRTNQLSQLGEVTAALRCALNGTPFPELVAAEIKNALATSGPEMSWAVRSAATAEDMPEASFAGQYETTLNVCGLEDVREAVRRCWISLFSERAVAYRLRNQIPHRGAAMAVLIQEMVAAEFSGVIF